MFSLDTVDLDAYREGVILKKGGHRFGVFGIAEPTSTIVLEKQIAYFKRHKVDFIVLVTPDKEYAEDVSGIDIVVSREDEDSRSWARPSTARSTWTPRPSARWAPSSYLPATSCPPRCCRLRKGPLKGGRGMGPCYNASVDLKAKELYVMAGEARNGQGASRFSYKQMALYGVMLAVVSVLLVFVFGAFMAVSDMRHEATSVDRVGTSPRGRAHRRDVCCLRRLRSARRSTILTWMS